MRKFLAVCGVVVLCSFVAGASVGTDLSSTGHAVSAPATEFGGAALVSKVVLHDWAIVGNWDLDTTNEGMVEHYVPVGSGRHSVLLFVEERGKPRRIDVVGGEVFVTEDLLVIDATETGNVEFASLSLGGRDGGSFAGVMGVWSNVQSVTNFSGDCGWNKLMADPMTGVWSRTCDNGTGSECTATLTFKDMTTTEFSAGCGESNGLSGNANQCTVFCE